MSTSPVFIGMDLGAFKTSVVCSNGQREVIHSAVAWPRDMVARRAIGRDVIFGDEAMKQHRALNLVRPFEKGVLKYGDPGQNAMSDQESQYHQRAARLLVEHAVDQVCDRSRSEVYGVIGCPSRASIENKQVILDAASEAFDAVMIIPEPFAVAFGMNKLIDTLVIDLGAGTIDICPMCGSYPEEDEQLTIAMGGDLIDEKLLTLIAEQFPEARASEALVRTIKEKYGFVHDTPETVHVLFKTMEGHREFDLTSAIKEACSSIVEPIVAGVTELLDRFEPEYQATLLSNVLLAGGGSQLRGLDRVLEERLSKQGTTEVHRVYDSVFAGAAGALKLAMNLPEDHWQQVENPSENRAA